MVAPVSASMSVRHSPPMCWCPQHLTTPYVLPSGWGQNQSNGTVFSVMYWVPAPWGGTLYSTAP